jgi:serine/threonine protein kinase/Tol biopolymer transport system component
MTEGEWKSVWELFGRVTGVPDHIAQAMLDSSTEDPAVVNEVRVLLSSRDDDASWPGATATNHSQQQYAGLSIGRYRVGALIGSGSTGEVYSGRDLELERPVAMKFISPEYSNMTDVTEQFIREAQAASALNHPNIVTIYEVIRWESSPVIVMELVEGVALRAMCDSPLPLAQATKIGSQILQALACAHASGIVHHDLKPENVMVRPDGYIKVLDFGLARQTLREQSGQHLSAPAGVPVGTLRYMSPEQCRGEPATPHSDVFAAGIVMHEMITGRHPFYKDSPLDTAHAIVWSDPSPVAEVIPDVAAGLASVIIKMLAKEEQARPTAAEAAKAVAVEGTRPEDLRDARDASGGRNLTRIGLAAAVVVILGCAFWLSQRSGQKRAQLRVSPLASLLGAERQPSFSADGHRVAFSFSGANDATSHIYVKNLVTGAVNRLTSDALSDYQPVFSPDGKRLVFLRRADGRLRVMVMPSDGGTEHQVAEIMDVLREYSMVTWDAKGQNIIVSDRTSELRAENALFEISADSGTRRQITFPQAGTSDWMPSVSIDRGTLGYARVLETGRGDLWEVPLQGGTARRLTTAKEVFFCWSWSAGGRELLIAYRRAGRVHLWRQPTSGGRQVRVAGLEDQVMEVSVAGHGGLLAYGSGPQQDYNVWSYPIPPSTERPKQLIASAAFDGDARYSHDGTRIAFASTRSGQSEIWTCASDGSDVRQVTSLASGGFTAGSPSWSPDGRWLAFDARSQESESSIFVIDALGGKPVRLTGPGPSDIIPNWSRDSRSIYFSSDRGGGARDIWKVPRDGSQPPARVTHNGGFEIFESPDGQFLYHTKGGRKTGFWRLSLAGGIESAVPELATISNRFWEASDEGVYFVAPSSSPSLSLFRFADHRVTHVADLPVQPSPVYRGVSISLDRRSLLYMQADVATSNLQVVQNFH